MWKLLTLAKDRLQKLQQFRVSRVEFVTEQLGDAETELKEKLIKIFQSNRRVLCAYLLRVRYPDADQDRVALCLKHSTGQDLALVRQVEAEFGKMFNHRETLDIMFLTREQEERIAITAKPFYRTLREEAQ